MIISERIFKIMADRQMSQIDFSRKTGISQSTISDWKRKRTNPAADKIMRICEVLNVTPDELLQDTLSEGSVDYIMIRRDDDAHYLVEEYKKLDRTSQDRLIGYLHALKNNA